MRLLSFIGLFLFLTACSTTNSNTASSQSNNKAPKAEQLPSSAIWDGKKIQKTDAEWQAQLSPESYKILRRKGTEHSFCSPLLDNKKEGTYCCAACSLPLFTSKHKFNSGTGWPSFFQPVHPTHVGQIPDNSHGMERIEVVCNRCDSHLGHVFEDGPAPTGLRFCINGASLSFVEE